MTRRKADAVFSADHLLETNEQVGSAIETLYRPDSEWVEWPWPDMTAMYGRMAPRQVWFVCAFSGNGKTLFVTSALRSWIAAGVKTYVLPLETTPDDFRLYLACQTVGIDPGTLNSGGFLDMSLELRSYWERKIDAELVRQATDPAFQQFVKIKGVDEINLERLKLAAREAAAWGAQILVVDHIDHVGGDEGSDVYAESFRTVHGALKIAQHYNLVLVLTSQMNNEAVRGGSDRLAQFGPPMPHHVFMGGEKRKIATGMIGLHRRLRPQNPDESLEEYHAALKRSKTGDAPPMEALEPGVMAVSSMKLRNLGAREGGRCFLAVEHGIVKHLSEKDRTGTTYGEMRRV